MNPPDTVRLSLALPVYSRPSILAAMQVVIFMVRAMGRIEVDLLRYEPPGQTAPEAYALQGIVLAATNVPVAPNDPTGRSRLEQRVRARVERQYARHGIPNVDYDLQML